MFQIHRVLPVAAALAVLSCAPVEPPEAAAPEEDGAVPGVATDDTDRILEARRHSPFAVEATGEVPGWPRSPAPDGVGTDGEWVAIVPGSSIVIDPVVAAREEAERDAEEGARELEERAAAVQPDPDAAPDEPGAMPVHEVRSGETFWGIAQRYGVALEDLANANLEIDPGRVQAGDRLRIPVDAIEFEEEVPPDVLFPVEDDPAPADEAAAPRDDDRVVHEVQRGETLWGIARQYGVMEEEIRGANDLRTEILRVGQELVIPVRD